VNLSTKAVLLSGLVFPGIGHLALKKYFRASVLVLASLAAVYVLTTATINQAMAVVDRINSGEVALDTQAISEAIIASSNEADNRAANASLIVLGACWLFGIVDAWRLGNAEDRRQASQNRQERISD
jgi:hypothetical protein